ncbi:hypothetical protein ScPMuIL_008595 [Solemya velum]
MGLGGQLILLLWKNFVLQKRKICVTIVEILVPIFFAVILLLIRRLSTSENITDPTTWPSFEVKTGWNNQALQGRSLYYSPNQLEIAAIMANVTSKWSSLLVKGFPNQAQLLKTYEGAEDQIWAAVVFDESVDYSSAIPKDVKYAIRFPPKDGGKQWRTRSAYPFRIMTGYRSNDGTGGTPDYYKSGFLTIQYAVDRALVKYFNVSAEMDDFAINLKKMPYPPFVKDPLISVIQFQLPFFLMLSFVLSSLMITKSIVFEKERKLKESMKMMGLSNFIYWASWFLKCLIYMSITLIIYGVLISVKIVPQGSVLANSDPSLVIVFLLCYGISIISFAFMTSTFFNKATTGSISCGIMFFLAYFPYFFLVDRYETMPQNQKLASCLIFNIAMAFGINCISFYEGTGMGVQWSNFQDPGTLDDNFPLLYAMVMLLVDTVIYFILAWYIDAVRPGEFGVPQPLYFPFTKAYWCGGSEQKEDFSKLEIENVKERFEQEPQGLKLGIALRHLRKVFGGSKKKVAVDNMTLNMYEGQLTVLLGHNGAGKTTTMSMMSGFLPPTSGTAVIYGLDIKTDLSSVRKGLGLCPQHNILFDTLTVEEHLKFFAQLKGCPSESLNKEVTEMVHVIGLDAKRYALSKTLSGGQKRKLSVGIALIAGSKVIILDEPTSGMDPSARRDCWEILKKYKEGRTMLLTTHFMDEADILGDRIAIMAEGVVKCCGSSHFLKKAYGAGYHLVVVKNDNCDIQKLTTMIKSHIQTAQLETEISAEIVYLLPFDQSAKFEKLFTEIEQKSSELGISSFGTSATTMEEVFLKVGETAEQESNDDSKMANGFNNSGYDSTGSNLQLVKDTHIQENVQLNHLNGPHFLAFNENIKKNYGFALARQQFYGMFVKKFLHTLRNLKVTIAQLLLPIVFAIFALSSEYFVPDLGPDPALAMNLAKFEGSTVVYSSGLPQTPDSSAIAKIYADQFKSPDESHLVDRTKYPQVNNYLLNESTDVTFAIFRRRYPIATDFQENNVMNVTSFFNDQPYHSPGISLALSLNAVMKYFTDDQHSIHMTNFPLPRDTTEQAQTNMLMNLILGFNISFTILFGMAFLVTSFIIFLIKERNVGAKHLQSVSGVGTIAYWLSNFCWDYINYLMPVLGLLIVFAAFGTEAYNNEANMGIVFFIFLIYGWAVLPFVYLFHYLFKTPASGMVVVTIINILTGLLTLLTVFILQLPSINAGDIPNILDWVFTIIFPNHCLGQSLNNMFLNYEYGTFCNSIAAKFHIPLSTLCALDPNPNPCCRDNCGDQCMLFSDSYLAWESPGIGRYLVFMVLQGIFFGFLAFAIELALFQKLWYRMTGPKSTSVGNTILERSESIIGSDPNEDSDVLDERNRINSTDLSKLQETDSLILKNLAKSYGPLRAVKGISVGIAPQECFGLLGQNGAGKTTTFKMLTGDVIVSGGNAYLYKHDIKQHIKQVQQNLGYCPQFDALIDQLTGRETLTLYARLRGVKEHQIYDIVEKLMEILMMGQYADKQTGTYSGGNKRKLSTAIALIGDPPFILLDEPSTGMDPKARRQLWNVLSGVRASGRTLILTSHSMEECDALCTRIVIMVNGKFVCYGSPQHLKNKFGHGYTLVLHTGTSQKAEETQQDLLQFLNSNFQVEQVFDDRQGYIHIQIPDSSISVGKLFGVMEQAKLSYTLEDYAVHQTTLEQVFLTFTRHQIAPNEEKKGVCSALCGCLSSS